MSDDIKQLLQAQSAEIRDLHRKLESIEKRHEEIVRKLGAPGKTGPTVSTGILAAGSILTSLLGKTADRKSGKIESVRMTPRSKPPAPVATAPALDATAAANLRDSIITVLIEAGRPLSFQDVFIKLKTSGAELPADKPKLAMRKILYNRNLFDMIGGLFTLKPGILPMGSAEPGPSGEPDTPAEPDSDPQLDAQPGDQQPGNERADELVVLDPGAHQMNASLAAARANAAARSQPPAAQPETEPDGEPIPPDEMDEEPTPQASPEEPITPIPESAEYSSESTVDEIQPPPPETLPASPPAPAPKAPSSAPPNPLRLTQRTPFMSQLEAILGPGAGRMKKPE